VATRVERSPGLGGALGFVLTDKHTLQSSARPNVFALGDATNVPISKAGSVTHFEGEVLAENVARFLAGRELDARYDGHANCFIETGFHKALLIDFNYDTEPLPGRFPSVVGLPLLRESRLNHLGKLMFQWLYWYALLPGRELPGLGPTMPTAGKRRRSPRSPSGCAPRVFYGDNILWPTRGPNACMTIDGTMRNRGDFSPKSPANDVVRSGSSTTYAVPDSACHAGGRGFESRRSRFSKCLQIGTSCCLFGRSNCSVAQSRGPNV